MWRRSLIGGALIVLIGNGLGLVLGAGRDIILAARFGATEETDAYFLAFTVPNLVWQSMLAALMASFIPSYSQVEARAGRREADRFARGVLRVLTLVFLPLTAAYAVAAPWLFRALGDYPQTTLDQATELSYIMAPLLAVSALSSLLSSLLYAHDHYALPALGQGLISGVLIVCILALDSFGITSVAVGTLVGFLLKFGLEIALLCRLNPSYRRFWVGTVGPHVWGALRLLVLALIGFNLVGQGTQLLERAYASNLDEGSLTALQYATKLGWVPLQFASAIAVALLPPLSRHAVATEETAVESPRQLTTGVGLVTLVTIPAAFALLLLADPITGAVYTRQAFGDAEARLTSEALQGYAWGLPAVAASLVLWNVLYARRDMKTPVLIGAVALAGYALLNSVLGLRESLFGLALSNALTSAVTLAGILIALRLKGGAAAVRPVGRRLLAVARVALLCLALPTAVAWLLDRALLDLDGDPQRVAFVAATLLLYAAAVRREDLDDGVVVRAARRFAARLLPRLAPPRAGN
jgi:putative peptidoglycan lipid II flippase